ncbi:MAG: hypothetical protein EVA68_01585 [OM182 bacterium]|uniref:Porin n=1 Tax=OM182 bacterium TaxID=2510334 RepID=A0A520S497_9GAMM|nr:MAG: hypothetical protein EVA68_01585 [OM182 bacterium]
MFLTFFRLTLITCLSIAANLAAADEIQQVKTELLSLLERIEALEDENNQLKAVSSNFTSNNKIDVKGDLRYRYEDIQTEGKPGRERSRVRARISGVANPTKDIEIGIGLASGGSDPTSTNQTLGNGGTSKGVVLDLAYFSWKMGNGVGVIGGKFKNVFYRPEKNTMMWDGDYNPEGLAVTYNRGPIFINTGLNWLESDAKVDKPIAMLGAQIGYSTEINSSALTIGAGFYDFPVKGRTVFRGDNDDFFGNSFMCTDSEALLGCKYNYDYEEIEVFVHLKTSLANQPTTFYADYVHNKAATDLNTGFEAGLIIGKASEPASWQFGYSYRDLEADAVFGAVGDSDVGGGGTDVKGHVLKGKFAINKTWKLALTYFDNKKDMSGKNQNYDRFQIDTEFKF